MKSAILAALEAAKDADVRALTRTALVKYVYLLDCLYAESHNGETASGAQWHLNHFGPFAVDLVETIDTFESQGVIQSREGTTRDKDFKLYWLPEHVRGQRLTDFGLSGLQEHRFTSLLKKFANDLSSLLDHVYFDTSPMVEAKKVGDVLDFSPDKYPPQSAPRQHLHIIDQSKIFRLLELNEKLKQKRRARNNNALAWATHRPIYDAAYKEAMAAADAEADVVLEPIAVDLGIE